MGPIYDIDTIKFGAGEPTFGRAVGLYEKGKVTKFKNTYNCYQAVVLGTHPYHVSVSVTHFDRGDCDCYLGKEGVLCKHMVAVALWAVKRGKRMSDDEKLFISDPVASGKAGELTENEYRLATDGITDALRYIKAYSGPSRTWFAYQDSLSEGCNRLSAIISAFPAGLQTAKLLVATLLRLERKIMNGGVDDSDGTVGNCMAGMVEVLVQYARLDPECAKAFKKLEGLSTSFGWEEPLVKLINEQKVGKDDAERL